MTAKPRWVCTNYGMWSGRKDSVKRHITSQHDGISPIVSFIDYLVGRRSGQYPPSAPPTYQGKTMTNSFMDEVYRASAKELVRHTFNPHNLMNQSNNNNTVDRQRRPYCSFWTEIDNIFGLGAYICTSCFALKPFKICCPENDYDKGLKKEFITECVPAWLNNTRGIDNIEEYITRLRDDIPSFLSRCVNAWTNNNNEKSAVLTAIQITNPSSRRSIELILNTNTGLKKSISLPYEEDKCKDLVIPSITASEDHSHWATRAISQNQTVLRDDELLDFLIKLNNNTTFGFFNIKTEQAGIPSVQTYLMAIARNSLDLVR
jgi:hypothetical protein